MFNSFFHRSIKSIIKKLFKTSNIYDANWNKKKTDLTEMIVHGCITNKLNQKRIEDISLNKAYTILTEKDVPIKSLPGYGNLGLRKKYIKSHNDTISIKIKE